MPDMEVKRVADYYEEEARIYDNKRFSTEQGRYMDEMQKNIVLCMVDCWGSKRILEVGCGTGRFTLEIAKQQAKVVALDPVLSMLNKIRDKVSNVTLDTIPDLIQASGYELPFEDNTFDGCISINVINHLHHEDKVFKEVGRVVKPGGFLIMNFSNLQSLLLPAGLWINHKKRSLINDVYTQYSTLAKVTRDLRRAGFKIRVVKGNGLLPTALFPHWLAFLVNKVDIISRDSFLRYIASVIFVKAESDRN